DSEPVPVRTLPFTPGASQLRLSRPSRVSHTVTRPAEIPTSPVACTTSRQETLPAGIRSDPFSRTRWPMNFAYPPMPMGMPNLPPYPQPFDPYSAQSVWSGQGFGGRSSSESSSFKDEMRSLTTSIHKIQATVNAKFWNLVTGLILWSLGVCLRILHRIPPRPPRQLLEDDSVSLAPRSQEGNFLDDQDGISDVDSVDFMACSGIVKPESKGYYSFPESGHFTTALSFVNSSLAENLANTSKTGGSKFSGFGPASYPGRCRSKDFEIHGSSLDLRSMLLQVDKSLGMSQFLLLGTVANFTLAKRQEILEKSTVSEALQQRLVSSPLSKDKLFSVSLEQLQEEVNKAPPVVKVDVKVTDGKRFVKTTQMNNPSSSSSSHQPKASTSSSSSSQSTKRPAFSRPNYSSGKKAKVVKGKKQVGGRLSHFLDQWALITSDKWVLSILRRGLELQFLEQPPLSPVPINLSVTKDSQKNQLLQNEVNILIQKGGLEEVNPPFHLGFYSRLFLVPKKNGKMRPVLDLSVLNQYLVVPHFKMETNRSIRSTIHLGTWTTSLDLMDAYFHIPISHKFRHFLRLVLGRQGLQFQGYAFWPGYCTPSFYQDFSDGGVVIFILRAVLIHSYLDDSLIKNHCRSLLEEHTNLSILLLLRLGFLISWEKSEIIPSQSFNFLGEHFRTDLGLVLPPEEKVVKVRQLVNALTQFSSVPARQLLQLVGFLISIMDVIPLGRLHIRPIQWYLIGVLASNFSVVGGTCSHPSSVVTSSSMVASGKTSSEGSFVGSSRPQPNFVHRCESDGLGSLSGGQDSIRPLVRCSVGGTHQSSRDESCVSFSPSVSGCDSGSVTTGCHGQLHSSGLSSESRRDPFLFSVSSEQGNSSSVSQSQYFSVSETCSRQSKSSGGCSLPFPCSSEHRMGNSSISVSGDHSSLGSSSYRSFCHQSESQIGDLRFSHSRRESLGSRCYDPILEGNVQLHVPSFSSSSKDLAQDSEGSLQDHSYCSGLVQDSLGSQNYYFCVVRSPFVCL
ncbi:Hypothetical predicted protein, partial [Mytilus galloprovincialis]